MLESRGRTSSNPSIASHSDTRGGTDAGRRNGEGMRAQAKGPARVITTIELPAEALTVIAAPPDLISQRNVEAVTGIPPRVYLDELRAPGFPVAVIKVGKLRLVEREAFLSYLRARASQPVRDAPTAHDGVAAVLAEIGLEPAPKRGSGQTLCLPEAGSRGKIRPHK